MISDIFFSILHSGIVPRVYLDYLPISDQQVQDMIHVNIRCASNITFLFENKVEVVMYSYM
jgi:hypothetical protein